MMHMTGQNRALKDTSGTSLCMDINYETLCCNVAGIFCQLGKLTISTFMIILDQIFFFAC